MEKQKPVKPVRVVYICDSCKKGEMKPTGHIFQLATIQYEHVCPVCGFRKTTPCQYPKIDFIEEE
ncbi:MAG: hypothetical protein RR342_01410 [Bacilli bacterium]